MLALLPHPASPADRLQQWSDVRAHIVGLMDGEDDWVAAMATVSCELHHAFEKFHWTGFYRVTGPELLVIGPYQGTHGCLRIPFSMGVCGAAAREQRTQRVDDVNAFPGHIACASSTQSEIVVPVMRPSGEVLAVLDVDSNHPAAFDALDQVQLEAICAALGAQFG